MNQAARGQAALDGRDFTSAITHYTEAICINPSAVQYYIKRSTAYTRVYPSDHGAALKDAEIALSLASKRAKRELIAESQLRRAIALFGLDRFADAKQCLEWVKKLNDKEKSLQIWQMKTEDKLKELEEGDERLKVSVTEIPAVETPTPKLPITSEEGQEPTVPKVNQEEARADKGVKEAAKGPTTISTTTPSASVQTPASKIRHEWYQTHDSVIVTLYCKGIPKDKTIVDIKQNSLEVSIPLPTGSDFQFSLDPLFSSIDHMKSYYKILSTKAEFTLLKTTPGQKWSSIEGPEARNYDDSDTNSNDRSKETAKRAVPTQKTTSSAPAYPTSSKSGPKNWDRLASDLNKRPKKEPKEGEEDEMEEPGIEDEEGDATTNFFKMLYKNADEDTKRAMMKSYQESNGTALSTNWSEVGKGPVETSPPDGMEARKWGE